MRMCLVHEFSSTWLADEASQPGTIEIGIERTGRVILSIFIGGGWPCGLLVLSLRAALTFTPAK